MLRKSICFLVLVGAVSLAAPMALASGETAREKLARTQWSDIHGINFVPVYARNTYEIWRNYDHAEVDRELGLAASVGFNSVRLWLNYAAFEELGAKMVDRVEDTVRLCAKHHLRAVVVLFDSCGVRVRPNTQWIPAREAYEEFQASARFSPAQKLLMKHLFDNFVHGIGANVLVPVAPDSPMMTIIWRYWQPTPGNDRLGPEWYPKLEQYVDAIVGRFKANPNVILWDLMNEPEFASEGPLSPTEFITPEMEKTRDAFLEHFLDYVKRRYPNQLVSEGWADLKNAEAHADWADVITFHVYGDAAKIQSQIDQAQAFAKSKGKHVVITETLANWTFGSPDFGKESPDATQLAQYQKVLPVLMNAHIGWMSFGLMAEGEGPSLAIFSADGKPRPTAVFLEETLKGAKAPPAP